MQDSKQVFSQEHATQAQSSGSSGRSSPKSQKKVTISVEEHLLTAKQNQSKVSSSDQNDAAVTLRIKYKEPNFEQRLRHIRACLNRGQTVHLQAFGVACCTSIWLASQAQSETPGVQQDAIILKDKKEAKQNFGLQITLTKEPLTNGSHKPARKSIDEPASILKKKESSPPPELTELTEKVEEVQPKIDVTETIIELGYADKGQARTKSTPKQRDQPRISYRDHAGKREETDQHRQPPAHFNRPPHQDQRSQKNHFYDQGSKFSKRSYGGAQNYMPHLRSYEQLNQGTPNSGQTREFHQGRDYRQPYRHYSGHNSSRAGYDNYALAPVAHHGHYQSRGHMMRGGQRPHYDDRDLKRWQQRSGHQQYQQYA